METGAKFIDSQAKSFAQELNIDNRTEQIAKQQAFITLKDHANAIVTTESETAGMNYIGLTEGTEKIFKQHGTVKAYLDTQRQQHQFYN